MRRVLIGAGIAVVVLVVGVFVAASLIDVNKFRPQIQTQIQKAIHRDVTLGNMSLKIFPLAVKIDKLSIADDPAFSQRPFATSADVAVSAGLFSILRGSPEVSSVSLNQPQVELIRNAAGNWNFSSMVSNQKSDSNSSLSLNSLKIVDGKVAYTDAVQNIPRTVYDHIGMQLTDYAPNKRFGLDLDVHFPGTGNQLLSLKSKIGPLPQNTSPGATPVDGKITLDQVTLSGISRFAAGSLPPNTDGTASGDATITSQSEMLTANGNLKLVNTTIKGSKIDYPISATFDLSDNRKSDVLNIKSADLKLGSTPFALSGTVDSGKKPVNLDVRVKTNNASITDLAKLAGSWGVAFNPAYQVKGQLTADINAKGPSTTPQLSGKISGRDLNVAGGEIKQPVEISAIDLSLSPASIVSNPFTAKSGSTSVEANFTATNYSSKNMLIDAAVKTANADIAELINMAKAYGMQSSGGMTGTGKLSLNAHVQGPVSDTVKMNYSGSGTISGATITAPQMLTKPVSVASANLSFAQNSAAIQNLAMTIGSSSIKGNLGAKNLGAPQISFQLAADRLNTTELQQLTNVPNKPASTTAKSMSKTSEPSLLSRTTGGGTLTAGAIQAGDLMLNNVNATVKLNQGVITMSPLTADLYGGKESGTVTLDTRPATPVCGLNAKLNGVNTNGLLSAVSSVKDTLYGSLAATSNLTFSLLPANELPKTLNGTLAFNVSNGELKKVNILNEISRVAKFLNPGQATKGGNSTALSKLGGSLNLRNGEATTNDLVAAIDGGTLSGKGSISLVSQALNMDVTAVLASGLSNAVGGTSVGGFLSTALANNKGELVVPVKVTGTLDKPVFTPDAQAIAQMKVKNLLPTTGNPGAGIAGALLGNKGGGAGNTVKGILGGLGGQQQQQPQQGQQQQQQQKPADTLKGLLKGLGKKQ